MKKISALKHAALVAGLLAANIANAALVGQWSADVFVIKSNISPTEAGAYVVTTGICIKSNNTYYLTAEKFGTTPVPSTPGAGRWIQSGNKVFMHGSQGGSNELNWALELNRVDATHLTGNSQRWNTPSNPVLVNQYFSNQLKYVGSTCLPPTSSTPGSSGAGGSISINMLDLPNSSTYIWLS